MMPWWVGGWVVGGVGWGSGADLAWCFCEYVVCVGGFVLCEFDKCFLSFCKGPRASG